MEKRGKNSEKEGIMFCGSRGDRFLPRIAERRSCPQIHEINSKVLGGDRDEERKTPYHGNFEGKV